MKEESQLEALLVWEPGGTCDSEQAYSNYTLETKVALRNLSRNSPWGWDVVSSLKPGSGKGVIRQKDSLQACGSLAKRT